MYLTKCYHLGITSERIPIVFYYSLHDKLISRVSSTTYFGISITVNLFWKEHCDKKANSTVGVLRRILSGCTSEVKNRMP